MAKQKKKHQKAMMNTDFRAALAYVIKPDEQNRILNNFMGQRLELLRVKDLIELAQYVMQNKRLTGTRFFCVGQYNC